MTTGTVPKRAKPGVPMDSRNSDLRGRLNDRHRFATFIMARTHTQHALRSPKAGYTNATVFAIEVIASSNNRRAVLAWGVHTRIVRRRHRKADYGRTSFQNEHLQLLDQVLFARGRLESVRLCLLHKVGPIVSRHSHLPRPLSADVPSHRLMPKPKTACLRMRRQHGLCEHLV